MPIIKSAKKRVKVANKATVRNSKTKRSLKTAVKSLQAAIKGGDKDADKKHRKAQSSIDQAAKKGVIHKNKAARKKSQLSKAAKASGTKKTTTTAKKPTKATTKKTVAKKPAAKKTTTKKTTKK